MPAQLKSLFDGNDIGLPQAIADGYVEKIVFTQAKNALNISLSLPALATAAQLSEASQICS